MSRTANPTLRRSRRGGRAARRILATVVSVAAITALAPTVAAAEATPQALAAGTVWGVDSAPPVTPAFLAQVVAAYGKPAFYGRYLHHVHFSLTTSEAAMLHQQGIDILTIDDDNGTTNATTAAVGTADANSAIASARALGVPAGVAIFRDVEAGTNIDAAFVAAYSDAFAGSGYLPGFYENPRTGQFPAAFCGAVKANAKYASDYLYADEPDSGNTGPAKAPSWKPLTLSCGGQTVAWQYGLAGGTVPSVDTDEALTTAPLWRAVPTVPVVTVDCPEPAGIPRVVRLLYMTVLARCPDTSGFAYWSGRLAHGATAKAAFSTFQSATTFVNAVAGAHYRQVLGRAPSSAQTSVWGPWLKLHSGSLYLDAILAGSPEFFTTQAASSNPDFVAAAYQRVLGRAPDAGAAAYWSGYLARGGSRFAIAVDLVDSPERLRRLLQVEYQAVLDRAPDAGALAYWVPRLQARPEPFWLDQVLAGSSEFVTLAQTQPPFHAPTTS